eukprot:TRINITY_DN3613_c0_g2_i1.p1 TRINITY_DN3613_c0_g2~~TRINITY_DN3613_c0_g2_i1.p1  ORF type:complete len:187 (+),score=31.47 TRINITY_DN3613_c0_g2_i1:154-714(+)
MLGLCGYNSDSCSSEPGTILGAAAAAPCGAVEEVEAAAAAAAPAKSAVELLEEELAGVAGVPAAVQDTVECRERQIDAVRSLMAAAQSPARRLHCAEFMNSGRTPAALEEVKRTGYSFDSGASFFPGVSKRLKWLSEHRGRIEILRNLYRRAAAARRAIRAEEASAAAGAQRRPEDCGRQVGSAPR